MVKLIKRVLNYFNYIYYFIDMPKVNMALSRAAATSQLRIIDETEPVSWEFCGFSQSGGDGIIDFLTRKLLKPNRYFIEIGSNTGIENNTAWLAFARRYTGMMIDGDARLQKRSKYLLAPLCLVDFVNIFVNKDSMPEIKKKALHLDPDVFSLDIDGIDYYVVKAFLDAGFRPKIIVAEYNSCFGPEKSVTIEYRPDIYDERAAGKLPNVYWGCSLAGWKNLLSKYGYKFLTVDSNGVDAFFINPKEFDPGFVNKLKVSIEFRDNFSTFWYYKNKWEDQFALMKDMPFVEIT